jgi:hypothetical protein
MLAILSIFFFVLPTGPLSLHHAKSHARAEAGGLAMATLTLARRPFAW